MRPEAADLREKVGCGLVHGEHCRSPGPHGAVATEDPRGARQVPAGGDEERHRALQARAGGIGSKSDLLQCGDGEVARTPARHPIIERMIHSPARAGSVEDEDLRALRPLRARAILPVAIAGVQLAAMAGEEPNLGAAHEVTGTVPRPCRKGELEFALASRWGRKGGGQESGANTAASQGQSATVVAVHHLIFPCALSKTDCRSL